MSLTNTTTMNIESYSASTLHTRRSLIRCKDNFLKMNDHRYIKEIGLIISTYSGYIEIFDNCDFNSLWSNKKEMNENKRRGPMSITLIDYSEALDM